LKIPEYWQKAKRELAGRDAVMARLTAHPQALTLRSRGDAFSTLARAIVGQQISVKAAQSVWNRVLERAVKVTPANLAALDGEALRGCGLSSQKTAYLADLAGRFESGALKPRRWSALEDEALIDELTEVKGIGRWTAEMFLIFYLARPNVLPLDDIGLQRAMRLQYNKGRPLSRARMERIARVWAPWRSVATWYLWRSLDTAA
jgi:DNA-3-methyladenine glycosylase II